jgi:exosortase C (VPDSG-CTERM-specific)
VTHLRKPTAMLEQKERPFRDVSPTPAARRGPFLSLPPPILVGTVVLIACFSLPLYRWVRFALESDLYSYVLLVPFVTAYLLGVRVKDGVCVAGSDYKAAATLGGLGIAASGLFLWIASSDAKLPPQDLIALSTLSFVLLFAALWAFFVGGKGFLGTAFPLAFLGFMAPFPLAVEQALEQFLQHGSAPPAHWLLQIVGTPVFRQDMVFQLPNSITLQIAPECSGIRSTVVLFITSLLAGDLFLRSPWKRAVLVIFVIPLALARNGLRVFTIAELCVRMGPHMFDSWIHHRGGPIFFALSLIPFSLLLFFLVKADRAAAIAR